MNPFTHPGARARRCVIQTDPLRLSTQETQRSHQATAYRDSLVMAMIAIYECHLLSSKPIRAHLTAGRRKLTAAVIAVGERKPAS